MTTPGDGPLQVCVALALPHWQSVLPVELAVGSTVADALNAARRLMEGRGLPPDVRLDWEAGAVGIFGVLCERSQRLEAGDRVELYRPLPTDPKENRRRRARSSGTRRRN